MAVFPQTPNKGFRLTGHTWLDPLIQKLDNPGGTGIGASSTAAGRPGGAVTDQAGAGGIAGPSGVAGPGGLYGAQGGPGGRGTTGQAAGAGGQAQLVGGAAGDNPGGGAGNGGPALVAGGAQGGQSGGGQAGFALIGTTHTAEVQVGNSGVRFAAFGVSGVQQPANTVGASSLGYTAGSSNLPQTAASSGGIGTKVYTLGDVVAALKTLGWIAR